MIARHLPDFVASITLLAAAAYAIVSYRKLQSKPSYDRVAEQGDSNLLSANNMNAGYRLLQPVGAWLAQKHVHPDTITLASLGLVFAGLIACIYMLPGVAALAFTLAAVCDALDGLVARMSDTVSDGGKILDSCIDRYADAGIAFGYVMLLRFDAWLMLVPMLALAGSFMISYTTAKSEAMSISVPRGSMKRTERAVCMLLGVCIAGLLAPFYATHDAMVGVLVLASGIVAILSNFWSFKRIKAMQKSATQE